MPPSPQRPRRFLVVGCGSIGKRHISNLQALGVDDVIAFDPRPDRRAEASEKCHVPVVERLEDAWPLKPDVAVIATPTAMHIPPAIEAAERGCHLFIEKPLSDSLDGVSRLLELVRKKDLITFAGFNTRFIPGIRQMKALITEGAVGKVVALRAETGHYLPEWHPWEDYRQGYSARRQLGGGVILDAIHELDYVRELMGEVESVSCLAGKLSHLEIDTEDVAAILLRHSSGAISEIHLDYVQRARSRTCHVIGDQGTIRWHFVTGQVRCYRSATGQWETWTSPPDWQLNQMYVDEMQHFLNCLDGKDRPLCDVWEGERVLRIALAARESAPTGAAMRIRPPDRRSSKVVAIVQARMGSTRLPGKVLADVAGRPMLWYVTQRVRRAKTVQEVVVATTTSASDEAVVGFCQGERLPVFRGSEDDVLDRYYQAARAHGAGAVVRITADCPFIDPGVIDRVVGAYLDGDADYVSNTLAHTFPDGLDTEVFSMAALETAWKEAKREPEREHVTPYIKLSDRFRVQNVSAQDGEGPPDLRLTVDEGADLEFTRALYALLGGKVSFALGELLKAVKEHPEVAALNRGIIRNEGYYKSLIAEEPMAATTRTLAASQGLKEEARRLIPSYSQTFSKGPTQFVQGVSPVYLARARGSHVWDVDDNEYIDYSMALGPVILGHADPDVNRAIGQQMESGYAFSLPHPLEVELAKVLVEMIPCAEMVRFAKNGSDVTAGAVRAARGFTGRDMVAFCGYHGWQDWYIGATTRNKGVPAAVQQLVAGFEYNNLASLERIFAEHRGQVAAVIMEPAGVIAPQEGFLQQVKDLAHREGALLIFDEVITGFRMALGGAQEYFKVTPDLGCFGKAMGNGYPIAAVVGRRDVMEIFDEVFFSFTFGGDALGLAAALATIRALRERKAIDRIWEQGERLRDGYNTLAQKLGLERYTACIGYPPRTVINFKDDTGAEWLALKSLFQQEVIKRGVLCAGYHMLCASHSAQDVEHTLRAYRAALGVMAEAIAAGNVETRLEGPPVSPVFRRA
ncbi:MAG TPA: aminotransferase class III-fold pyridoxal phosphate-dependent enzyme [Terriglobales bacterium]|nr:aminotransferase class III-fold pyridoxal phosphate-dependent enzyme [Terriglobales bacterium]